METALIIVATLGLRELIALLVNYFLTKSKTDAEIEGIQLTNAGKKITDIDAAVNSVENLRKKIDGYLEVISALKESKIDDDRKIASRDGIIKYQREDLDRLHRESGQAALRIDNLEKRVTELERHNKELVDQELQLRALLEDKDVELESAKGRLKMMQAKEEC
jgi:chromosome segregation ATPase